MCSDTMFVFKWRERVHVCIGIMTRPGVVRILAEGRGLAGLTERLPDTIHEGVVHPEDGVRRRAEEGAHVTADPDVRAAVRALKSLR